MKAITLVLVAACATTTLEPAPTKVFDFSPRPLAGPRAPLAAPTASPKAQLRSLIDRARPQLASCIASGTLDIEFTLALDAEGVNIESVEVANPCARDVLLAMDTSWVTLPANPERWQVHAPLYTGSP
jgi:hypothetical protein